MFSPRLFVVCAFIATVSAVPASDKPFPLPITTITETDLDDSFPWYFPFGNFKSFFTPFLKWFPSLEEVGPKIDVDEDKFTVTINVKDYNKADLKVKVKNDFILVQGTHEAKHDAHDVFASQFFHTYSLPQNCSASDVTALLTSDGFLVVTAPLNGAAEAGDTKDVDRDVPIVESGNPLPKEEPSSTTDLATGSVAESDKKEPTTSSNREDVTERDNNIPHGSENEILP